MKPTVAKWLVYTGIVVAVLLFFFLCGLFVIGPMQQTLEKRLANEQAEKERAAYAADSLERLIADTLVVVREAHVEIEKKQIADKERIKKQLIQAKKEFDESIVHIDSLPDSELDSTFTKLVSKGIGAWY